MIFSFKFNLASRIKTLNFKKFPSLTCGQRLIVLTDEEGIALVPADTFEVKMKMILALAARQNGGDD